MTLSMIELYFWQLFFITHLSKVFLANSIQGCSFLQNPKLNFIGKLCNTFPHYALKSHFLTNNIPNDLFHALVPNMQKYLPRPPIPTFSSLRANKCFLFLGICGCCCFISCFLTCDYNCAVLTEEWPPYQVVSVLALVLACTIWVANGNTPYYFHLWLFSSFSMLLWGKSILLFSSFFPTSWMCRSPWVVIRYLGEGSRWFKVAGF